MRNLFRCAGLTLALLLVAGSVVRAQDTLTVGSVVSNYSVTLSYDTSSSTSTSEGSIPVGPFPSTLTAGPGSILDGAVFCIDLWHGQNTGSGLIYNPGTLTQLIGTIPAGVTFTAAAALGPDLNYLGYVFNQVVQHETGNTRLNDESAIQLAIWKLIDTGPKLSTGATTDSTGLNTNANTILGLLTSSSNSAATPGGLSVGGMLSSTYGSAPHYTAEFFMSTGSGEQNLLSWTAVPAVPEPSSMAIAGLGALGMIGYGLRRRKSS